MYTYTFKRSGLTLTATGFNLFNGANNIGLTITRADKLGHSYLKSTKFNDVSRTIWAINSNNMFGDFEKLFTVTQKN